MNRTYSLLLAACASVALLSTPALAGTEANCVVCGAKITKSAKPYPVKVVNPTDLPRSFVKSTVNIALTLDEQGVPVEVKTVGRVDRKVASRLISAVSQWRFSPMYVNGVPVAGRVVLPIEVTPVEGA